MEDAIIKINDSSNKRAKGKRSVSRIIMYSILILLTCIQLFPLVWLVDFSLNKNGDLFGKYILKWPNPPQFSNYVTAWVDGNIGRFFLNSVVVNGATVVITTVLVLTMSFAFTRMEWKLRGFVFNIVLLGLMIPIHVTLLPNFFTFKAVGVRDSYLGLIIPYVAFSIPFGVFLMSSFIETSPKAIQEAAVIDGCNIWTIIFKIIMPLTKPAIVTVVVTTFLNSWNEFIMAATYLTSNAFRTLPFAVYNFAGQYASEYAIQFAVMTLTAIPSLVVYIILNEQITKGVTFGAVK